jgi:excisionase family DNA binding protein
MNSISPNERLLKFLQADPEKQAQIDDILEGRAQAPFQSSTGPLLYGMSAAAKVLGVSRATLWRILRSGRLPKIEVLPGSFRVRRADLEVFASDKPTNLAVPNAFPMSSRLSLRKR